MNKKVILIPVGVILLLAISYMGNSIFKKIEANKKHEQETPLPHFSFETLNGAKFTYKNIKEKKPILIMHFSPTCDQCFYETEELVSNIDLFKEAYVLMVTSGDKKDVELFVKATQLIKYPQIKVLLDHTDNFYKSFGSTVSPSIFAYTNDHILKEYFRGGAKMNIVYKAMFRKD